MATLAAIYKISADISGLQSSVAKGVQTMEVMEKNTSKMTSSLATMGKAMVAAFSVAAITGAVRSFTELTGQLTDLSAKTGIGTTSLQKLKLMAEQSGGSLDQVTRAITKMGINLVNGDKGAVGAMDRLGLSINAVRQMQPDQAFALIADKIATIESPMERAQIATELFGKAGADILPMMTGHLQETTDAAERLGLILNEETVAAGDKFGDTMTVLQGVGMSMLANVLKPLLPAFTMLAEVMTGAGNVITWLQDRFTDAIRIALTFFRTILDGAIAVHEVAAKMPLLGRAIGAADAETIKAAKSMSVWLNDTIKGMAREIPKVEAPIRTMNTVIARTAVDTAEAAKATKVFANDAANLVKRVEAAEDAHLSNDLALRRQINSLQDFIKAQRVSLQLIDVYVPALESWQEQLNRVKTAQEQLIPSMTAMNDQLAEQQRQTHGIIEQAEGNLTESADKAESEMRGLISVIGQFGAMVGGKWGDTITNVSRGWLEGAAAADAYAAATTKAGQAMALVQGAMAVWNAAGAESRTSATLGGAAAGAKMGMAFGPWGALIGGAAGAIVGFVRSAGQGREAVEAFAESFGGFYALHDKLAQLPEDGERMWIALTQGVGKNNPEQARAAIEAITAALDKQKATQDAAAEASVAAAEAIRVSNEAAVAGITDRINGLTAEYNSLWDSIKDEAPEEVMGQVEAATRLRMMAVADEREHAISELQALTDSLSMGFDEILSKLDQFIDRLGDIPPVNIRAGITYHDGSEVLEDFAGGSSGISDFGNGTLSGRDSGLSALRGNGGGTTVVHTHLHLDGREIATNTTHHQSQQWRLRKMVGAV